MIRIDYYMTPMSPWTYLGADRFMMLAVSAQADVKVIPTDFSVVFPATGGLPLPKRAPARQAYRMQELKRWRDYLGIDIVLEPQHFPCKTPMASLLLVAARSFNANTLPFANALGAALWRDDRDIDDEEVLAEIALENRLAPEPLFERARQPEIAEEFAADAQKALEAGVFGAPSYVVDGEIFWGQDRLDLLAWRLGVEWE